MRRMSIAFLTGGLLAALLVVVPAAAAIATEHEVEPRSGLYSVPEAQPLCKNMGPATPGATNELCYHWVTTTSDAIPLADANANGVPDHVETVMGVFDRVWEFEINQYGYRPPRPDLSSPVHGPNGGLDIYLADVGSEGSYGSCDTDDPARETSRQVSAYCVLDNDYAAAQYAPGVSGLEALQVTAAHEFFHAVQFAYDWKEASFLTEGTATWMEDEVFDDVNANYVYLHESALHQPEIPLDAFGDLGDGENFEYGAWLWWRFMSEAFAEGNALSNPTVIREVWERAEGEMTALDAVAIVAADHNFGFHDLFAFFGEVNRAPNSDNTGLIYEEGPGYLAEVDYRYPPWDATFDIYPGNGKTGRRSLRLDHLSNRYVQFFPGAVKRGAKLRTTVDLPSPSSGVRASMMVISTSGDNDRCYDSFPVSLNSRGEGSVSVPFGKITCDEKKRDVFWTTLVFTNAGTQDDQSFKYSARLVQ